MSNPTIASEIESIKDHRRILEIQIHQLKLWPKTKERDNAITRLQESVMWLGMDLRRIGEQNPGVLVDPYPNSKNPDNPTIELRAEELRP